MEPQGIRKVFAEQNAEGAIYHLYEMVVALQAQIDANKPVVTPESQPNTAGEGN